MKITTSGYLIKNWLEGWKVSENRGGLTKLRMYQSHPWFVHDGVLAGNILIGEGVANQPDKTKYWGKFWVSTYLDSWPWVHTLRDKLGWAMGGGAHGRGVESTPQSWASFKKSNTTFSLVLLWQIKRGCCLRSTIWGGGLEAGGQDKVSADLGKTVELLFDCLL